jgi:hypothetical protein
MLDVSAAKSASINVDDAACVFSFMLVTFVIVCSRRFIDAPKAERAVPIFAIIVSILPNSVCAVATVVKAAAAATFVVTVPNVAEISTSSFSAIDEPT